ncbi:MAG: hypothetical protein AAFV25_15130 [Bacteroidota bacterium]
MKGEIAHMNRGRAMLENLRRIAKEIGLKPRDVRPHELVMYVPFKADSDSLDFNLNARKSSLPLEILLNENDMFVAHGMAIGIHKVLVQNSKEVPGITPVVYYPEPALFAGPAANTGGATEAQSLEMLYNGQFQAETELDIRIKEYSTRRFRYVPQTQQTNGNSFQTDGCEVKDLYTGLGFWGGNRNDLKIKFGLGDYSACEGSSLPEEHVNYAVVRLCGNILVGGAKKVTAARLTQALG